MQHHSCGSPAAWCICEPSCTSPRPCEGVHRVHAMTSRLKKWKGWHLQVGSGLKEAPIRAYNIGPMFYKFPRNQQKCCVRDKDAHNSFTGITGSCSNVHHWFHGLYHPNQSKSPAKYIRMEQHAGTQPKVPIPMCKITPDCAQEVLSGDGCFLA